MIIRTIFAAALFLGLMFLRMSAQDKTEEVVRVDTALVNIPVIVSDRSNRYIPGLAKGDFRVFQDGAEQKIDVFSNDQAPMSIVLALDTSLSTYPVLGKIKKAAKEFIKDLDPDDRCMIVSFDYDIHLLSTLTSDKKELESAIKNADIGSQAGTVLNDALYRAVNSTLKNVKGRKAVILLTDGKDHGSYYRQSDLIDRLTESDTVVYPVFYETGERPRQMMRNPFPRSDRGMGRFPGGMGRGRMGRFPGGMGRQRGGRNWPGRNRPNAEDNNEQAMQFLEKLADVTGGRFFREKKSDLRNAFLQIADEMKRQYLVGFYPAEESQGGSTHKVKVQVNRPDVSVRAKSAYRTQAK